MLLVVKIALLASLLATPAAALDTLHMSTGHNPPLATDDQTGFHDLLEIEAFRRIGIDVKIHRVPTARAGRNADTGMDAGLGPRIAGFDKVFPNLVRVPEPATTFEFVGFTKSEGLPVGGWEDLKPYHVGVIAGSVLLARHSAAAASATSVTDAEQLFTLLAAGRIDIALIERWQGLQAIRDLGLRGIRMLEPPFSRQPMYFYLNRRHADLAPRLAEALRDIKSDGTYDALVAKTLAPLREGS